MNRKEVIQGIITTMQREIPFPVIGRDLELPINSGQMITAVGVRRCGKSCMMKHAVNSLYHQDVDLPIKIVPAWKWFYSGLN